MRRLHFKLYSYQTPMRTPPAQIPPAAVAAVAAAAGGAAAGAVAGRETAFLAVEGLA